VIKESIDKNRLFWIPLIISTIPLIASSLIWILGTTTMSKVLPEWLRFLVDQIIWWPILLFIMLPISLMLFLIPLDKMGFVYEDTPSSFIWLPLPTHWSGYLIIIFCYCVLFYFVTRRFLRKKLLRGK